jgi:hypothetical protein
MGWHFSIHSSDDICIDTFTFDLFHLVFFYIVHLPLNIIYMIMLIIHNICILCKISIIHKIHVIKLRCIVTLFSSLYGQWTYILFMGSLTRSIPRQCLMFNHIVWIQRHKKSLFLVSILNWRTSISFPSHHSSYVDTYFAKFFSVVLVCFA